MVALGYALSSEELGPQLTACYAESSEEAIETAWQHWPNGALGGDLGQELGLPRHFRQATEMVTREDVSAAIVCGPDAERHLEAIYEFVQAGFDRVYIHQVGPEQQAFLDFCAHEILPDFAKVA